MGINFDDEIQGLRNLNTLPDSWKTLRVPLKNSSTSGKVTTEYAKRGVLNEEVRRKSKHTSSHSDVQYTEDQGRYKTRDSRSRGKKQKQVKIQEFKYYLLSLWKERTY